MPQGSSTTWAPTAGSSKQAIPGWRSVDEEEALLGVSTGFFEHNTVGQFANKLGIPLRVGARNNRQNQTARPSKNTYHGVVRARSTLQQTQAAQFNGASWDNRDTVLGYNPSAWADPEPPPSRLPLVVQNLPFPGSTTSTIAPAGIASAEVVPAPNLTLFGPNLYITNRSAAENDEGLLGVSTSFFEHSFNTDGTGPRQPRTSRIVGRNNRWTSPGRTTWNLYFGTITARAGSSFYLGSQFDRPYVDNDVLYGYTPNALRDLEPPPSRLPLVIQALQFTPEPTPPVVATNRIPAEVLPHLSVVLVPRLPYSPAPKPPTVAAGPRGFDDPGRPKRVIQNLPFSSGPPTNTIAPAGIASAEVVPTPGLVLENPNRFATNRIPSGADDEALYGTSITAHGGRHLQGAHDIGLLGLRNNRAIIRARRGSLQIFGVLRARLGFSDIRQYDGFTNAWDVAFQYPPGALRDPDELDVSGKPRVLPVDRTPSTIVPQAIDTHEEFGALSITTAPDSLIVAACVDRSGVGIPNLDRGAANPGAVDHADTVLGNVGDLGVPF